MTREETVVLMTILDETVTMHEVCALIVQIGDAGLIRVKVDGRVVMRNPFYKL